MLRRKARRVDATPEEIELAKQIVTEELGDNFYLDNNFPKNIGVKGDEGIYGDTVAICSKLDEPAKFLAENTELIGRVSNKITSISEGITRVLFEIAPQEP